MGRKPWLKAIEDLTHPVTLLNNDILEDCKKAFIADTSHIPLDRVMVYTDVVAVNGAAGVHYCDKMNRKSSAGCPYKRSKKHYLEEMECALGEDLVFPIHEIRVRMGLIAETYWKGERWHPVFCGHLKDEPVSFAKALEGSTRLFTSSPMAWTILVRKYLLSVIVHMQNNRYDYECAPGIIAQSVEWERLRKYLVAKGKGRIVAGDYVKFDKRMSALIVLAAFDIVIDMCKRAGYTEEDLKIVRGISIDTAFPNVDFNGDFIEFFGSNPSGHPLTVIINCLANSLYIRYCYAQLSLDLFGHYDLSKFKEHVNLMTYGDDNAMGVSEEIPWFNHTSIQKCLLNVDIGYTMADKNALSIPYIDISECTFLKRSDRKSVV